MTRRVPRWQGDPLVALATRVSESGPALDHDAATLLPDPVAAMAALRGAFMVRGQFMGEPRIPAYLATDAIAIANQVTAALHHDLPTPDRRDTATIWDKWRKAVLRVRAHTQSEVGTNPYPDTRALDTDLETVEYDLARAFKSPGEVARYYCPWAADFFTFERLHPEAL